MKYKSELYIQEKDDLLKRSSYDEACFRFFIIVVNSSAFSIGGLVTKLITIKRTVEIPSPQIPDIIPNGVVPVNSK